MYISGDGTTIVEYSNDYRVYEYMAYILYSPANYNFFRSYYKHKGIIYSLLLMSHKKNPVYILELYLFFYVCNKRYKILMNGIRLDPGSFNDV